ncbi:hypothetical protein AB0D49_39330 [Streptomyces sp. NPDC048290]|uniref:hypothetical protein n=1 Tax=Streptomyces sp. NPDC048290 TaxID=3155811 RepID=UPI00343DC49F
MTNPESDRTSPPAPLDSLAAYLCGAHPDLDSALRSGRADVRPVAGAALHALRLLPVHTGPVFRMADVPLGALDLYQPGTTLFEPGFVAARHDGAPREGNALCAIWSVSGRRTALLGTPGAAHEVLFPAGSHFVVLAADLWADGSGRTLLLTETGPDDLADIEERLRHAAAHAPMATEDPYDRAERHWLPIGVNRRLRLFRAANGPSATGTQAS